MLTFLFFLERGSRARLVLVAGAAIFSEGTTLRDTSPIEDSEKTMEEITNLPCPFSFSSPFPRCNRHSVRGAQGVGGAR